MIHVLIVGDQPVIRHGIAEIIAQQQDMEVTGESQGGDYLSGAEDQQMPDVVVLDSEVIQVFGSEAVASKVGSGHAPVFVLTTSVTDDARGDADRVGAFARLPKAVEVNALLESIRTALVRPAFVGP